MLWFSVAYVLCQLRPVFGVRVMVTFHLKCVHIICVRFGFSVERLSYGKLLLPRLTICSLCILTICNFCYFPF